MIREALEVMAVYFGFVFAPFVVIGILWLVAPKFLDNLMELLPGEFDEQDVHEGSETGLH